MEPPPRPSRPPPWRAPAVMALVGPVVREGIPPLCDRVRLVLEGRPAIVICDVGAIERPDVVVVEALACMQLTAMRLGSRILLRGARPGLTDLLDLCGLSAAVPLEPC